jgi:ADP-ribose pyrophosphatase
MAEHIKRLKRELMYRGTILDIYKDTMQLPDGGQEAWDFVSHRLGAAAVLPVLPDGRIVMVRQYRNALERETLEIPAGSRDNTSEDTAVCAARELEEETGYRCGKMDYLLSVRTTVAFCNEFIDVYVATGLEPGTRHLDAGESIDMEIYPLEELCQMVYEGKIQDGKTVAAIMAYSNKVKQGGIS